MPVEHHVIESSCGEYSRDVWLLRGSAGCRRLAIFLDGEHYVRDMKSTEILEPLLGGGSIPSMTCVFVSHLSGVARHEDYTCNARYARFIAEDVVAWARADIGSLESGNHLLCGLSLSGLQAAMTVLQYPFVFSYSLCQSGSFWWLADHDVPRRPTNARFWLSVGSDETVTNVSHPPTGLFQRVSQIEGVKMAAARLQALGATVRLNLFSGGHGAAAWRDELAPAVTWLLEERGLPGLVSAPASR